MRPCTDLSTVWRMVVRTAFVQLHHSWLLLLGTVFGMSLVFLVPPLCFFVGGWDLILHNGNVAAGLSAISGGVAWAVMTRTFRPMIRLYRQPLCMAWLLPLAAYLYTVMTVDSALRFLRGEGGAWKGRTYEGGAPQG
jgi:hypothetical protein